MNAWSLVLDGDYIYVADSDGGLKVVDATNITNPEVVGRHTTTGAAKDIKYKNGKVFLAVGAQGVDAFDVSDPDTPVLLDNHATNGFASRVALHGNKVSVSAWQDLEVFEWDGETLTLVGYKNTGGRVMAVGASRSTIIYSAEWARLRVYQYGFISDADIDLSTRSLTFASLDSAESDTLTVHVENNGGSPLEFLALEATHSDFTYYPDFSTLSSGDAFDLHIVYTAHSNSAQGEFNIVTNDPDEPTTSIELLGNNSHQVEIGAPAPGFELPVIANSHEPNISLEDLHGDVVVLTFFASW